VVIGKTGFIGAAIIAEAAGQGVTAIALRHHEDPASFLNPGDVLVNCTLNPDYKAKPYEQENDAEARTAGIASRRQCRVIMLSTRRVYGPAVRWGAVEDAPAAGDESLYGRNKSRTEQQILSLLGDAACILRVSNAFGYEYTAGAGMRKSFFGAMLYRLKHQGEILFDMQPETRRDFLPVEAVARAVLQAAAAGLSGIYNIGAGFALSCGSLADQLIAGYGSGVLHAAGDVTDEFYLDTKKWTNRFGPLVNSADILNTARMSGERLRHE
jgi:nucleoside-diphosphate-sugar epimerase